MCVCSTGSGKEDSTSRASSLKNQVRRQTQRWVGAEISQLHKVTKALFIVQVQSRAREGPLFSVEFLRGRPAIPNQTVTGAGRVPKAGKGDARWKKQWRSGPQLNATCRAAASGALLLGFHRPRLRFAEQNWAARAEKVKTNKQKKNAIESRSIGDCAAAAAQGLRSGRTEAPLLPSRLPLRTY